MTESITDFTGLFTEIFTRNGLERFTDAKTVEKFFSFAKILSDAEEKMNLSAIKETGAVILKHFADSLICEEMFDESASAVDIGCGAGFPSIPLAIVRGDLSLTPIDSTGKKIDFVKAAAKSLGLTNVAPACARAEEFAGNNRESFDIATARAVSRLNVLSELALPLVKVGGFFIAMKAKDCMDELKEAEKCIKFLGGEVSEIKKTHIFTSDGEELDRIIVKIAKIIPTPSGYPRSYAKITKKPL